MVYKIAFAMFFIMFHLYDNASMFVIYISNVLAFRLNVLFLTMFSIYCPFTPQHHRRAFISRNTHLVH
jgi:archaellum biogenesis protein FlaJ (TadC family)